MKTFFRTLALAVCLLLSHVAFGEKPSANSDFSVSVNIGDEKTVFKIKEQTSTPLFVAQSPKRGLREGKLSAKSYNFILQKAVVLLNYTNDQTQFCPRSYIKLEVVVYGKKVQKNSCVGATTVIAKKMTALANSLDLLFL